MNQTCENAESSEFGGSNEPRPLTLRQQAFCDYYLRHGNAARAARECGYSSGNAADSGSHLLKDPRVAARIEELRAAGRDEDERVRDDMIEKLERIYQMAVDKGNLAAAVRAVEAQARIRGYAYGRKPEVKPEIDADELIADAGQVSPSNPTLPPPPKEPPVKFDRHGDLIRDYQDYLEVELDGDAERQRQSILEAERAKSRKTDLDPDDAYWENL